MTKQECLTRIFKANKARELTYMNILHIVMRAKKTTEYADIDQVGLIQTLQEMTAQGIILQWTQTYKEHVDCFEWKERPVWVMVG